MSDFAQTIDHLQSVIAKHKKGDVETSYVAKIYAKGRRKIAQKIGEEAVEVAIAATDNDTKEVICESADLLFHLLILWENMNISANDIGLELARREGISGIEEKNSRRS